MSAEYNNLVNRTKVKALNLGWLTEFLAVYGVALRTGTAPGGVVDLVKELASRSSSYIIACGNIDDIKIVTAIIDAVAHPLNPIPIDAAQRLALKDVCPLIAKVIATDPLGVSQVGGRIFSPGIALVMRHLSTVAKAYVDALEQLPPIPGFETRTRVGPYPDSAQGFVATPGLQFRRPGISEYMFQADKQLLKAAPPQTVTRLPARVRAPKDGTYLSRKAGQTASGLAQLRGDAGRDCTDGVERDHGCHQPTNGSYHLSSGLAVCMCPVSIPRIVCSPYLRSCLHALPVVHPLI